MFCLLIRDQKVTHAKTLERVPSRDWCGVLVTTMLFLQHILAVGRIKSPRKNKLLDTF